MYAQESLGVNGGCVGVESSENKASKAKEADRAIEKQGKGKVSRYNLALPAILMDRLQDIAAEDCTTILEIIRRFIKLGLIAYQTQKEGGRIIIEKNGEKTILTVI